MIRLFKRKSGTPKQSRGNTPRQSPEAPSNRPLPSPANVILPAEMLWGLFGHLAREGQFIGAFDALSDFDTQMFPNALQAIKHKKILAGGILDKHSFAISFSEIDAPKLALASVGGTLKQLFKHDVDWQVGQNDELSATMPFGPPDIL